MKRMTLTLAAASLFALPTFAQVKTAPKIGTGKPRTATPAAPTAGGRVTTAPVAGSKAKPTTAQGAKVGIGSTSATKAAPGGAAAAGSICASSSAFAKAPQAVKAALLAGEQAGVSGSACASKIKNTETLAVLAAGVAAGTAQVKSEGKQNAAQLNLAGKARVRDAMAAGIAAKIGVSQVEGLERLNQAELNGCDFTSRVIADGAVKVAAASN